MIGLPNATPSDEHGRFERGRESFEPVTGAPAPGFLESVEALAADQALGD